MGDKPAVLGNEPVFQRQIRIVRPVLPEYEEMAVDMQEIVRSGMLTKGQHLRNFENAVARHLGAEHAIGVSSCTTGLMLTYKGLGLAGDVVVPSFTFMATVSALVWAGLRPVFADVDRATTNLTAVAAEAAITPATTAIVAVHNFGNPADINALEEVAKRHGIKLVFDAAHGFGALHQGIPVGTQGDAQVFSLSPTKLLISGEGGVVATNDDDLAEKVRQGREYGNSGSYDSAFAGLNARLAEFNALLGQHSLGLLESAARRRNEVAHLFQEQLGRLPGIGFQEVHSGNRSSYKDFSITVETEEFGLTRDELAHALAAENVDTRKYYEPPAHRQTAYSQFHNDSPLPDTEWLSLRSLSLPIWSDMPDAVALGICHAVTRIHEQASDVRRSLEEI